ncbi:hypothetical protein LTR37_000942 [Vermiconidia calcicola]|uniref:Uncharacterized protein n=1 Tax=Vermiconidia calcicola TaxID=1690605 RepID=A0ACC3NXS5_9PEZI|nr:hypothetical protein LTR37_000942 [Vermiconidia calcicola]
MAVDRNQSEPKWLRLLDDTTDRPAQIVAPTANTGSDAANQQEVAAKHSTAAAALVEQGKQIMDRLMQVSTPIQRANLIKVLFSDLDNMYDAKVALLKELAETRPEEREVKKGQIRALDFIDEFEAMTVEERDEVAKEIAGAWKAASD